MDVDKACFMHPTARVVHNSQNALSASIGVLSTMYINITDFYSERVRRNPRKSVYSPCNTWYVSCILLLEWSTAPKMP